jgi:molecular chaperone GrpE
MITPIDDETLLNRFRQWLEEAHAEAETLLDQEQERCGLDAHDHVVDVGLYSLFEEFTALRHELKLQTKSTRGLQDQTEALLPAFRQAIEQFRSVAPRDTQAIWEIGKPLAEALADLDEALARGRLEIEKAHPRLVEEPDRVLVAGLDAMFAKHGWFRRLLYRPYHERARALALQQSAELRQPFFDALIEGYDLIQARLRRALQSERIERIECLGRPVDPERMTVLDLVEDPVRPPGEVVEELRRGYTWRDRILRYAEVRATRRPLPTWEAPSQPETDSEPESESETDSESESESGAP